MENYNRNDSAHLLTILQDETQICAQLSMQGHERTLKKILPRYHLRLSLKFDTGLKEIPENDFTVSLTISYSTSYIPITSLHMCDQDV